MGSFSANSHFIFITKNNEIKCVGSNSSRQLGFNDTTNRMVPEVLSTINPSDVKSITLGAQYTIFLMKDGTVKGCGSNFTGQLGISNTSAQYLTTLAVTNVKEVACGAGHTIFLLNDGTVKGCGSVQQGQLGLNINTELYAPSYAYTDIATIPITEVKSVRCGYGYTMFLKTDGTVYAVGNNYYGQLGLGHRTTPVKTITKIPNLTGVADIFCGESHTLFMMNDGSIKSVGYASNGQLGLGWSANEAITEITTLPLTGVRSIICSSEETIFIMNNDTVKGCGRNYNYQLALGHKNIVYNITDIPLTNVADAVFGFENTIFLFFDGTIKGIGKNGTGQLGINNTVDQTTIQDMQITGVINIAGSNLTLLGLTPDPPPTPTKLKKDGKFIVSGGAVNLVIDLESTTPNTYTLTINTEPEEAKVEVLYNGQWNRGKEHVLPDGDYEYRVFINDQWVE